MKSKSQLHGKNNYKKWIAARVLLAPFSVAEESISALGFARSPFYFFNVATLFSISTKHVEIAIIMKPFTNINFFNCSFSIL